MTPLEEAKRQTTEFLRRVSRELLGPLTSIKGSAAALLDSSYPLDPAETRQLLRIIDEQADQMHHLINDLVDITQLEAGALTVIPEPTDVGILVGWAREAVIGEGTRNGIEVDLAPDLPRVMADQRRMFQVLRDLLTNASEPTSESSTIRVGVSQQGGYVVISVEDEGRDILATRQPEEFSRTDGMYKGMWNRKDGLGLAICKGVVEAHGGRMLAESGESGRGSRFTITIPLAPRTGDGVQVPADRRLPGRDYAPILAVNDDPQADRYIRGILSQAGFPAVVTALPSEVEYLLYTKRPRLVVVDLTPPWTDGLDLMGRINLISDAPVIILAGHGSGENMKRAFELGAADYVVKPFTPTELVARVTAALRRRSTGNQAPPLEPYLFGDLSINYSERLVAITGRPVKLKPTEYKLLFELSIAGGHVLSLDQLAVLVWGPLNFGDHRMLIRTHVKEIRKKLGDDARRPTYIFTEHRTGYRMPKPETGQQDGGQDDLLPPPVAQQENQP